MFCAQSATQAHAWITAKSKAFFCIVDSLDPGSVYCFRIQSVKLKPDSAGSMLYGRFRAAAPNRDRKGAGCGGSQQSFRNHAGAHPAPPVTAVDAAYAETPDWICVEIAHPRTSA